MENYLTLFPPRASSSYHFTAPPSNFTSSMVSNTQPFASLHESGSSRGLLGVTEETKSLLSSHGQGADAQMETSRGSESEAKASKKKGEKKVKKPRYAFHTRSQVDILDDGYRWRKYGQKAVKNNKFPRSYYRCTHQGCNVKKQVQRLSRDDGVVVTTYEGMHTHPLEKSNENFEHILNQMQIYPSF